MRNDLLKIAKRGGNGTDAERRLNNLWARGRGAVMSEDRRDVTLLVHDSRLSETFAATTRKSTRCRRSSVGKAEEDGKDEMSADPIVETAGVVKS